MVRWQGAPFREKVQTHEGSERVTNEGNEILILEEDEKWNGGRGAGGVSDFGFTKADDKKMS